MRRRGLFARIDPRSWFRPASGKAAARDFEGEGRCVPRPGRAHEADATWMLVDQPEPHSADRDALAPTMYVDPQTGRQRLPWPARDASRDGSQAPSEAAEAATSPVSGRATGPASAAGGRPDETVLVGAVRSGPSRDADSGETRSVMPSWRADETVRSEAQAHEAVSAATWPRPDAPEPPASARTPDATVVLRPRRM